MMSRNILAYIMGWLFGIYEIVLNKDILENLCL